MRLVLFVAAMAGLLSWPADTALAEWVAIRQLDEFDQKHRYIAASSAGTPSLAFICEAETGRMRLFYKSGVRTTREFRKGLPAWPVWLSVIVDNQPVRSYPGTMSEMSRMLTFDSTDPEAVALSGLIANASRRVLVAINYGGEKSVRNEFPVAGSGQPILKVFEACAQHRRK